jgi:hypothetical protein
MDEYLFIAVAKLKADRVKLEQEQREQLALRPIDERSSRSDDRQLRARDSYVSRWSWGEQS